MPKIRDLGLIATPNGWEIHFGGNGGYHPRIADQLASNLCTSEVFALVEKLLFLYSSHAPAKTRSARFMEDFGKTKLLQLLKEDLRFAFL